MKKTLIIAVIALVALTASYLYFKKPATSTVQANHVAAAGDIVSKSGIHWHPYLAIYIKGQQQVIPADIGTGKQYANSKWYDPMMDMTDFHTHDNSGELHWEVMSGPVTKEHVQLKAFFEVWGKTFNGTQILDAKNGPDGTVKMFVNGQPNMQFENYQIKDGDKIEVRYE